MSRSSNKVVTGQLRVLAVAALMLGGALWPAQHSANAATVKLGILGDSNSDEYRADDNRGGAFSQVTFNWVEVLKRTRDVDLGPWGTRSEPRRTGYEYNWARSGAVAADLASQQAGLAQQIRDGKVQYVVIQIGANDFHADTTYDEVYSGAISGSALQAKVSGITAAIRSATQAVTGAGGKVLVMSVPDISIVPTYQAQYPDAARRQVVTNAINTINTALSADAAADPNVVYSDLTAFFGTLSGRIDAQGNVVVGGEKISLLTRGDEPHHMQLGDNAGHPGTVSSGLMANNAVVVLLNQTFGTGISPLTDADILCVAGIGTSTNCTVVRPMPPVLSIIN